MSTKNFSLCVYVRPSNRDVDINIPSSRTTCAWDFPIDTKKWQYLHYLLWKATQPLVDIGITYEVFCTETRDGAVVNSSFADRKKFFKAYNMAVIGAEDRIKEREQKKIERKVKAQIKNQDPFDPSLNKDELINEIIQRYSNPSFSIPAEAIKKAAEHIIDSGILGNNLKESEGKTASL
jgi:hypothetical protein